jgi:hypothetical protein
MIYGIVVNKAIKIDTASPANRIAIEPAGEAGVIEGGNRLGAERKQCQEEDEFPDLLVWFYKLFGLNMTTDSSNAKSSAPKCAYGQRQLLVATGDNYK